MRSPLLLAALLAAALIVPAVLAPAPAAAANPLCEAAGAASTVAGRACSLLSSPGSLLSAGKKLSKGDLLGTLKTMLGLGGGSSGGGSTASAASTALGLAAIGVWVVGGAKFALHETAKVLSDSTTPQLSSTWFSGAYWRIAGIGAILTLPFLFAAAVQALIRSDLSLVLRAALGYLPLALLAVSVAAPITMLALSATDQMSSLAASAAGDAGVGFLNSAAARIGSLAVLTSSPFMAFLVALFTAAGALVLWIELLMREAAVYVIVLMLPIVFAAFVWPARRIWVLRALELLVALILAKFAIVAVLALGGAAMSHGLRHSVTGFLGGIVLLVMAAFAPWALLRLVPFAEVASTAAGALRGEARATGPSLTMADGQGRLAHERWGGDWPASVTAGMRRQLEELPTAAGGDGASGSSAAGGDGASVPSAAGGHQVTVPGDSAAVRGERNPDPGAGLAGADEREQPEAGGPAGPRPVPPPDPTPGDSRSPSTTEAQAPAPSAPPPPAPPAATDRPADSAPEPPHPETLDDAPPVQIGFKDNGWRSDPYPDGFWNDLSPDSGDPPPGIGPMPDLAPDGHDEEPPDEDSPLPAAPRPAAGCE